MGLLIRASCLLAVLCLSFLELSSAQGSLGGFVPVGTYSRRSWNGDREFISSVGNAKVGIWREEHHNPRPLAVVPLPVPVPRPVPVYPPVRRHPPPVRRTPPPYKPTKKPYGKPPGVNPRGGLLGGLLNGLIGGR